MTIVSYTSPVKYFLKKKEKAHKTFKFHVPCKQAYRLLIIFFIFLAFQYGIYILYSPPKNIISNDEKS